MASFKRHVPAAFFETVFFLAIVVAVVVNALWEGNTQPTDRFYIKDWNQPTAYLKQIQSTREITLITRNTAQCYYLYRDQAMGFEYDMAKAFADFIGVRLTVKVADDWRGMLSSLQETPTGFIAAGLAISPSRSGQAAFCDGYLTSWQHIVVHRDHRQIRKPEDLAGRTVHVRKGSVYQEGLEALRARGIDVTIVLCDDVPAEELLRRVSDKTIDITIANSYVAMVNRRYYPQLVVGEPITEETWLGWAVDPRAGGLRARINMFFRTIRADGRFKEIFDRYYADVDDFDFVDLRAYHRRLQSRLPKYQALIETAAGTYGFDWRLIAAQIYQESHFDPEAKSYAGAQGLMQLTKGTADHLGVRDPYDPEDNIWAGVRHLKYLYDYFHGAEGMDRVSLALAAYNIGQGHLNDARRLARQQQLDPDKWSSLSETLPLLRYEQYYRQSTYGYCRGTEPVAYVKQTLLYYDILKNRDMPWVTTSRDNGKSEG